MLGINERGFKWKRIEFSRFVITWHNIYSKRIENLIFILYIYVYIFITKLKLFKHKYKWKNFFSIQSPLRIVFERVHDFYYLYRVKYDYT